MTKMIRVGIYLTKEQVRKLRAIAKRSEYPMAVLIRRALNEFLERRIKIRKI